MPRYLTGNMWQSFEESDLFCITTNSVIKTGGTLGYVSGHNLVMGKGIAGEAAKKYPALPYRFATLIEANSKQRSATRRQWIMGKYGFLVFNEWHNDPTGHVRGVPNKFAALQTKYDWKNKSPIDLVAFSIAGLFVFANMHPSKSIHVPFPGIGNGYLSVDEVKPYLNRLPDSVTIWSYT